MSANLLDLAVTAHSTFVKADSNATQAFVKSAMAFHAARKSGITTSAIGKAVKTGVAVLDLPVGVVAYTSNSMVEAHAIAGQLFTMADQSESLRPVKVQTEIRKAEKVLGMKAVKAIVDKGDSCVGVLTLLTAACADRVKSDRAAAQAAKEADAAEEAGTTGDDSEPGETLSTVTISTEPVTPVQAALSILWDALNDGVILTADETATLLGLADYVRESATA